LPPRLAAAGPAIGRGRLLRLAVACLISGLLMGPVGVGLLGILLPAFDYLPALSRDEPGLAVWQRLLAEPGLWRASLLSLGTGLAATLLAYVLAMALLAGGQGPLRALAERLTAPLVAVPHIALAVGLIFLLAPSGWIARLLSPWLTGWQQPPALPFPHDSLGLALVLGLVIKETPFLLLVALAALPQTGERERLMMARSLGYEPPTAWLKLVLPEVTRRIRLPLCAVLAYGIGNVEMALLLGPGAPPTLAVLILRWFQDPDLSKHLLGAAAALLQLGLIGVGLLVWHGAGRLLTHAWRHLAADGRRHLARRLVPSALTLLHGPLLAVALLALAMLPLWSIAGAWRFPQTWPAWTSDTWARQGGDLAAVAGTTLLLALASSLVALLLAGAALEAERGGRPAGRGALAILATPLLVPQIAFLFGTATAAAEFGLLGCWPLLLWGHLLFVLPYAFLSLAGPYRALDPRYAAVGASLGKGRLAVLFGITLPLLRRPLLTAGAVGIAVSLALYLPTLVLGAGRFPTLATEAVALSSGGDRRLLAMTALAQAAIPLAALWLALRAGGQRRTSP